MSFKVWHVTNEDSLPGGEQQQLVNFKAWHVTNEDSLAEGEEEGGAGW